MKNKRVFHDVIQGTDEWFDLRLGVITSSNFDKIMANEGKAFGEPAKKYAMKVALEDIVQCRMDSYSNSFMERGVELEPEARFKYEEQSQTWVKNGGFMQFGRYGDSIDGLVEDDGGIEVKSVIYTTHFERLIKESYDTSYKWQITGHMWINDLKWCDYISYCPEFPEHKQLYVYRVERDEDMIARLVERLKKFEELVDEYREKIK